MNTMTTLSNFSLAGVVAQNFYSKVINSIWNVLLSLGLKSNSVFNGTISKRHFNCLDDPANCCEADVKLLF